MNSMRGFIKFQKKPENISVSKEVDDNSLSEVENINSNHDNVRE